MEALSPFLLIISKDVRWLKSKKKYAKCDLLIIDDWLLEKRKTNEAREIISDMGI